MSDTVIDFPSDLARREAEQSGDPIALDTASPRHGSEQAAAAFDKLERLLRTAAPDMAPFVRCNILCAVIDYGDARLMLGMRIGVDPKVRN